MKLEQMIEEIKSRKPQLFGKSLTDDDAAALVRLAFQAVRREIKTTPEGRVVVPALGVFRMRKVARGAGQVGRKVVVFRLPEKQGKDKD